MTEFEKRQEKKIRALLAPLIAIGWVIFFVELGIRLGRGVAKNHLRKFHTPPNFDKWSAK